MPPFVTAYVGLGANLGDTVATLSAACEALKTLPHTTDVTVSRFYSSAPVGDGAEGPDYVNAVARLRTQLSAHDLLTALQGIEQLHGRQRSYKNAPRTLDLDLLLYNEETIHSSQLTVPHPRMHLRAFVLKPLAEISPQLQLPQGKLNDLLAACADQTIQPLTL